MPIQSLRAHIEGARTHARLDDLSRTLWQGLDYNDEEAARQVQVLAETIQARKAAITAEAAGPMKPLGAALQERRSIFPPRRYQRSPDRAASQERRKKLAASGPMPPHLAMRFTVGQLAVLGIVADEVTAEDACTLCVDAIAARAGVSRRLAQTSLRLAEGDGLLRIRERPRKGQPHDTNSIVILNQDWRAWVQRRNRGATEGGGCRNVHPSDNPVKISDRKRLEPTPQRATEGEKAGRAGPDTKRFRVAVGVPWDAKAMHGPHAAVRQGGQAREVGARACQVRS